jgi:hypothetical protein
MSYFKVVNLDSGSAAYFSDKSCCCFSSPLKEVRNYIKKNKNTFRMAVYIETHRPKPAPRWVPFNP